MRGATEAYEPVVRHSGKCNSIRVVRLFDEKGPNYRVKLAANNSGKAYEAETLINTACVSKFFFAAIIPQPKTPQNDNSLEIFTVK